MIPRPQFIFLSLLLIGFSASAQEPFFNGTPANNALNNAAFTGSSFQHRLSLHHQSMFIAIPGSPGITNLQYDGTIFCGKTLMGIGGDLSGIQYGEGNNQSQNANFRYSFFFRVGKPAKQNSISVGLNAGIVRTDERLVQYYAYGWEHSENGFIYSLPNPARIQVRERLGLGFSWFNTHSYLGLSADHVTGPVFGIDPSATAAPRPAIKLYQKVHLTAGHRFGKDAKGRSILVSGNITHQFPRTDSRLQATVDLDGPQFMLGAMHRNYSKLMYGDAQGMAFYSGLGLNLWDRIRGSVSYSYFVSNQTNMVSGGSWDFGIGVNLTKGQQERVLRTPWN